MFEGVIRVLLCKPKVGSSILSTGTTETLLNLREIPRDPPKGGFRNQEVPLTKHRTITGFVAVALVAVAATAVTMRSHSPWADGIVSGTALLKGFTASNKVPAASFDDRWSAISALPSIAAPQTSY